MFYIYVLLLIMIIIIIIIIKVSPLQALKVHRDVDARFHIYTVRALRRGG